MKWPWTKQPAFEPITVANEVENVLDQQSGTWRFIHNWALTELDQARKRNDAVSLDPVKTAAIRGEIKTLKRLANLPDLTLSRDNRLTKSTPPEQAGGDEYDE